MINLCKTARGFQRGDFADLYGHECSIQESSLATDSAIWLGCNEGNHYWDGKDNPQSGRLTCCARMHLNVEQVKELLPLLLFFVDHGELPHE